MRIAAIYNPASGRYRAQRVDAVLDALSADGHEVMPLASRAAGDVTVRTKEAADHADLILAFGGDGTFNEVINGLVGSKTPFLPVPMGTANVLSFEQGYSRNPQKVVAAVKAMRTLAYNPGIANGRRFVLMASSGVDAWAVHLLNGKLKTYLGPMAYVVSGIKAFFKHGNMRYRVTVDGRRLDVDSIIITRARYYGGPFIVAPEATLASDRLYAVVFDNISALRMPFVLFAAMRGKLDSCSGVRVMRCTQVTVTSTDDKAPFQIDGDDGGKLPLQVAVDDRAIQLVIPAKP